MMNREQLFLSEGYKYLAHQLDDFMINHTTKNKLTSKFIFKNLLKIIYSVGRYPSLYWSLMIQIIFCIIAFYIYIFCEIYEYNFPLDQLTFRNINYIILSFGIISPCKSFFREIKKANNYGTTIIERFRNYNIIHRKDNNLLVELTNSLNVNFFTLEDLIIFEIDLKRIINNINKSQKNILAIVPIFVFFLFLGLPTIAGLSIASITQDFTRFSGGLNLILITTALLTFFFNLEPRDIALYERFLSILAKVKIKANL